LSQAQTPTSQDLSLPEGSILTPADGRLVKSNQDKTVYLISNQQRYAFTSAKVFLGLGFKFSTVLIVTNPELQELPKAANISNYASAHLPGVDIKVNGTIYWIGYDNQVYPYPSLAVYNSWHVPNDFSSVVPGNVADSNLPTGSPVVMRVVQ